MKIELNKFYRTRDGRKVRIYEVYEHTIHGAILTENVWGVAEWPSSGCFHGVLESGLDIVTEWSPEPLRVEFECLWKGYYTHDDVFYYPEAPQLQLDKLMQQFLNGKKTIVTITEKI